MKQIHIFLAIFFVIFLFITNTNNAWAKYTAPKPLGHINDYANVLSNNTVNKLNSLSEEIKSKTGAEIAVVTLKTLGGYPIENIGLAIARQWGIGQKDKNNGALILVAPYQKKLRIEIGYGLEGAIPDSKAGRIRDQYMIPQFRQGNYELGIIYATEAIAKAIAKEYNVEITGDYKLPQPKKKQTSSLGDLFFLLAIFLFIFANNKHRSNRSNAFYAGTALGVGYGLGSFGGFGGNSGGFGGFGGGGFGGGGISGGW